jgi:hypothetical protein
MALEKKVDSKNAITITTNNHNGIEQYIGVDIGSTNISNPLPRHGKR